MLGFPSNEFGGQEPGTEAEIKAFARDKMGATFPLFAKIIVNEGFFFSSSKVHPLYVYLKKNGPGTLTDAIKWNFTKFLCDRDGQVITRYSSGTDPLSFEGEIERLLAAKEPEAETDAAADADADATGGARGGAGSA